MARSLKKGPFVDDHVMKKVIAAKNANDNKPIKTWSRRSTIVPEMIGLTFNVHNGKSFIPVYVTENHIGYNTHIQGSQRLSAKENRQVRGDNMSKAIIKFVRLSPTKARLIAREVQGMNAELALASLQFMPNRGAKFIANAISSAVANGGFEPEEVVVTSCRVDAGPVLKRFRPRARGTASKIRKPTSHVMVEVSKPEKKEA